MSRPQNKTPQLKESWDVSRAVLPRSLLTIRLTAWLVNGNGTDGPFRECFRTKWVACVMACGCRKTPSRKLIFPLRLLFHHAEGDAGGILLCLRIRIADLRINCVQVGLHAILRSCGHAGELDSIAHARIRRPHRRRDTDMLRVQPEIYPQHSSERKWHHTLDVAAIAAHIGGIHANRRFGVLGAKFQRNRDLMPGPAPGVGGSNRHCCAVERQIAFPRALLSV